jgi:hypothetical protein
MNENIRYTPENQHEIVAMQNEVSELILSVESELDEGVLESRERRDALITKLHTAYLVFGDPKLLETIQDIEERFGKKGTA